MATRKAMKPVRAWVIAHADGRWQGWCGGGGDGKRATHHDLYVNRRAALYDIGAYAEADKQCGVKRDALRLVEVEIREVKRPAKPPQRAGRRKTKP